MEGFTELATHYIAEPLLNDTSNNLKMLRTKDTIHPIEEKFCDPTGL